MNEMIVDGERKSPPIIADVEIPYSVISKDLPSYMKTDFYQELGEILGYYKVYQRGADFSIEGTNGDYIGSDLKYKKCKDLIDQEARFLFAHTPDVYINKNTAHTEQEKNEASILNDYIMKVFDKSAFADKLIKAAKDCFIGKRVACMLNFHVEQGISITFLKSYEFIYEKDNTEKLNKIVAFYTVVDSSTRKDKRIKRKLYEMENGVCYVEESLFDGLGVLVEEVTPRTDTLFTYIPAVVIINDGLSNDGKGMSEIDELDEMESFYSKLANADIDSGRKNMNAVRYTIDASEESTANLSNAPGAFWDLKSNTLTPDPKVAQVGMIESSMNYSGPLKVTLDRINNQMHSQTGVPDINSEQLQGVITSGKTLKALYWGLTVRCDEKMLVWEPAIRYIVTSLIDGGILYPESVANYTDTPLPQVDLDILVENNYALLEDDDEEKTMDLAEVSASLMSRKAYMKKWRGLTDEEIDEELKQILLEKQMFEDSMIPMEREESEENEELEPEKTENQQDLEEDQTAIM